jgi:hypothetical protein
MLEPKQTRFLRKTKKVGNSCGVILPKYLLGADVKVIVVNPPSHPNKDIPRILESKLNEILGIYILNQTEKIIEVLAVSTNIREKLNKRHYQIEIVPLSVLKKSLSNKETKRKIKNAKVIINKKLLLEIQKSL